MSIIMILVTLVIIGFVLWLINSFVPMAAPIKSTLNGLVIILVILWLLQVFGIVHLSMFDHLRLL
jgi:hypothetical protein